MKKLILAILSALLISSCVKQNSSNGENLPEGDFQFHASSNTYYGKLFLSGYASVTERKEAFCEKNCTVYEYVFFNILSSNNQFIKDYLQENEGNSFTNRQGVGLGCIKNGVISYWNDSDKRGMKEYSISEEASEAILNSNQENPIIIRLKRHQYTGGRGAPTCYSHFTEIDLAE